MATDGSDNGRCLARRPCLTFNRAYRAARPGDTVVIGGGTYPPQTVAVDPTKVHATANVTFEPAQDARVIIAGDLHMLGSHAVFQAAPGTGDFRMRYLYSDATDGPDTSTHVSFDFLRGAAFQIGPNADITIHGGQWGPNECGSNPSIEPSITPLYSDPGREPTHIVLDGLHIFGQSSPDLQECHIGGLSVVSVNGLVLRNTVFSRDMVYDMAVGDFTKQFGNPRNVVIENNVFGAPVAQDKVTDDGQPELQTEDPGVYQNWLVRFNSFKNGIALNFDGGAIFQGSRVVGNIGSRADCRADGPGVQWAYNLWVGGRCGPTDGRLRRLPYVVADPPAEEDFHLRPHSVAARFVRGASADSELGRDIDGVLRPTTPRAAGAYQPGP